jgi:hypothetical protein
MDLFGILSQPARQSMTPAYLPALVGNVPQRPEDRRMWAETISACHPPQDLKVVPRPDPSNFTTETDDRTV